MLKEITSSLSLVNSTHARGTKGRTNPTQQQCLRKAVNRMFSDATLSQTPDRPDSITWPPEKSMYEKCP